MVQVLCCAQAADKVVSVATIVAGALDLSQVGHLVKNSGLLVLSVASAAGGGKTTEEEWAVDHAASRRLGVGQYAGGAGTEDVGAVIARVTRSRRAALSGDAVEYCLDGACRAGRCALEVSGEQT